MNTTLPEQLITFLKKQFTDLTVKSYTRSIEIYIQAVGEETARQARYKDITDYIHTLRGKGINGNYLRSEFYGIKNYYIWLVRSGQRVDNPIRNFYLNDPEQRDIQFQNLFTREELELLLSREDRYKLLVHRNKLAISFYIYQGLTTGEMAALTIHDANPEKGTVFIKATNRTNSRILPLESKQVFFLDRYLTWERPYLIKGESDKLFIGKLGKPEAGEGFHYLIECQKGLFPDRNLNPKTVRQSVIVNLFKKGMDIKDVQLFAGHKYASTTEAYKPNDLTELKDAVSRLHPLGGIE